LKNESLERAGRLKLEAGQVMDSICLMESLLPLGEVSFTGSYFLDVMVYPDLDLYVPMTGIENIFAAVGRMASNPGVKRVTYENEDHPGMQGGLFMNLRVNLGDWGHHWKVDIWWLNANLLHEKMEIMLRYKKMLTPDLRSQIILYKTSLLNNAGRTPRYSGYFIYKAFLDEGLRDPAEITGYLIANGINFT
jgi:hypothetical protein